MAIKNTSGEIRIDNFNVGIAPSPHVGYGDMRNLDIYTIPGVARPNLNPVKVSSTTVTQTPYWLLRNPMNASEMWCVTDFNLVYKSADNGSTWTLVTGNNTGAGQGAVIWKDYLFVARTNVIDVYGPLSSAPAWTNSWVSIDSDTDWHPMIVSKLDGKIYGGAGKYVFSIDENAAPFVPATAGSYTFTARALDLPANYRIKCLAELGNELEIGTWMGTSVFDFKIADIFYWNRSDPSFRKPVQINDHGCHAMITIGNATYVLAGIEGTVYKTNGYDVVPVGQIPDSITRIENSGAFLLTFPGAIMSFKKRLFFGLSAGSGSYGAGVWSLNVAGGRGTLVFENQISTGNSGNGATIGALLPASRNTFLIGWRDAIANSFGIDRTTSSATYTAYAAYLESPIYEVGTNLAKRTFTEIEWELAKPLAAGQGVRIKYRTDSAAAWTTVGTFTNNTVGAGLEVVGDVLSHPFAAGIPSCQLVQIRAELTTTTNDTNPPELKAIILR